MALLELARTRTNSHHSILWVSYEMCKMMRVIPSSKNNASSSIIDKMLGVILLSHNDATYLIITKGYESFYYYQIMRDLVLLYKDARSSIMMILRMGTMHACKCMCVCVHMCMYICTHAFMCGTCGICVEVSMCAKWKCVWVISMCVCVLGMWDGSFDVYMCVCASV